MIHSFQELHVLVQCALSMLGPKCSAFKGKTDRILKANVLEVSFWDTFVDSPAIPMDLKF